MKDRLLQCLTRLWLPGTANLLVILVATGQRVRLLVALRTGLELVGIVVFVRKASVRSTANCTEVRVQTFARQRGGRRVVADAGRQHVDQIVGEVPGQHTVVDTVKQQHEAGVDQEVRLDSENHVDAWRKRRGELVGRFSLE